MRTELPVLEDLRMNLQAPDVTDATIMAALLADPIRASIVRILRDGPVCVCEMAASLGARENNVSNHLARLRDAGLPFSKDAAIAKLVATDAAMKVVMAPHGATA